MSTPVVMPQMGESIAEGTIVRWIKKVGDSVDRDEPLFEISTDKVDAEIPSPVAGVLLEIAVKEGETVPVNSVVATIGAAGEATASGAADAPPAAVAGPDGSPAGKSAAPAGAPAAPARASDAVPAASAAAAAPEAAGGDRRQKSSPLVRKIAQEHNVDIARLSGSGIGGRVTKSDILDYIEKGPASAASAASAGQAPAPAGQGAKPAGHTPVYGPNDNVDIQPMSVMRKKIAEHMVLSRRTSAHVYSVFEVSFQKVDQIRKAKKAEYERQGAKLTFTSFIAKAVVDTLRRHPVINASIDGDNIVYKKDINLGMAVALDNGLIVPVVKQAGEKSILGLSKAIQDVADRARAKKLSPDEVQGGTFTITNPGNHGVQFGLPVINQPQVAILGVGTIEKRVVVVDDAIAIRLMGYLTLGYDHRLVDGVVADQFLADLKKYIETFDAAQV
ncbi:MAG: dihydrolipoamide acetyltransferase family protein [Vicinamibacterales bacterium]|nr:dihydrolipoamide acetyltransferase family protein [Vicinamibacterales bacterium]